MNPYENIDRRRFEINAMSGFNPTTTLPDFMSSIWVDGYKHIATKICKLVDTSTKPPAHHIFMFNVMASGERPFTNDSFHQFATAVSLVYAAEIKKSGANGHNQDLFSEVAAKMIDWYAKAQVCGDGNLQRYISPSHSGECAAAKEKYMGHIQQAQQTMSGGGWGQQDNWGNASSSGWGASSGSSGWGGDSWTDNTASSTIGNNSSGWDTGEHQDSGDTSGWGDTSFDWGDSETTTDTWGNMDNSKSEIQTAVLDPVAAALAAAMGGEENNGEAELAVETTDAASIFGTDDSSETDWGAMTIDEEDAPTWFTEDSDTTVVNVNDAEQVKAIDEIFDEDLVDAVDILDLLQNPNIVLHGEKIDLPEGFIIENFAKYHSDVMRHFDSDPVGGWLLTTQDDNVVFAVRESEVYNNPSRFLPSMDNDLQYGRTLCADGKTAVYLINENMDAIFTMINLDDHDIYNIDQGEVATLLDLTGIAQPANVALKVAENVDYLELCDYNTLSAAQAEMEAEFDSQKGTNTLISSGTHLNNTARVDKDFVIPNVGCLKGLVAQLETMESEYPRVARMIERFYMKSVYAMAQRFQMAQHLPDNIKSLVDIQTVLSDPDETIILEYNLPYRTLAGFAKQLDNLVTTMSMHCEKSSGDGADYQTLVVGRIRTLVMTAKGTTTSLSELFEANADSVQYRIALDSLPETVVKAIDWERTQVGFFVAEDRIAHIWPAGHGWLQVTVDEIV